MNLGKRIISTVLIGVALSFFIGLAAMVYEMNTVNEAKAVQQYKDQLTTTRQVCLESRRVINGTMEERCGQLQDATDTEFICDVMGRCWLEWHGYQSYPPEPLREA